MATIRSVMKTNLLVATPDMPLRQALTLLLEHHISGLPVVNEKYEVVGILTEKDLMKLFYEKVQVVGDLMTPRPQTFSVDAPLVDVVDCLMANNFRRVLIHENGRLVGLISRADLIPTLMEILLDKVGS